MNRPRAWVPTPEHKATSQSAPTAAAPIGPAWDARAPDACAPDVRAQSDRAQSDCAQSDAGSITPMIIGMMLCLLLLGAGVTAAGSAFLGGQRVQHLCDGAAAAAAGTITDGSTDQNLIGAANTYLAIRGSDVTALVNLNATTITLTCSADVPITFGSLFGSPTLRRTVTATGRAGYRQS
ncbi:MAG: pilus assembly protein TadG-related protein [Actinomycetota bacterium]|nr:pilus assembly protein TadG-related protein [Actinomycetota bacterium]